MKPIVALLVAGSLISNWASAEELGTARTKESSGTKDLSAATRAPIGTPGQRAHYKLRSEATPRASTVTEYSLALGPIERRSDQVYQWLSLECAKAGGVRFRVWLLSAGYPPWTLKVAQTCTARYIVQEGTAQPVEFRDRFSHRATLPSIGGWQFLLPRSASSNGENRGADVFPREMNYLGHDYLRADPIETAEPTLPPENGRLVQLQPDLIIGMPSNTRQKDERRRYDNSDYEYVKLTRQDFREMMQAGISCLRVDADQLQWVEDLDSFFWGVGANELPYPECLYRSSYLGPGLFLDEPAVCTRDYVIRPRLANEPAFRQSVNPQMVFQAFQDYFLKAMKEGAPRVLLNGLKTRADIDLGTLQFPQENLFSWETMVESSAYQLSQDPLVPQAMVFEPPGRVGTLRTLPELDMTYGCQLVVNDPKNLTDIIYGFLRGGARVTDKSWGTSIYGAVDRTDAAWFLTHAYDLGATRFFFWDNAKLACVPYGECLSLARNLRAHAESNPSRDLQQLKHSAEVAILLPPGYNLGHVHLGKGSLWGITELNLERVNRKGVKYRTVMSNFFTEIERCIRLGVAFDLLWDLPQVQPSGYREIVRAREDGKVEVNEGGKVSVLKRARTPPRPAGAPPGLIVELSRNIGAAPLEITARATVIEKSAPVYYTHGADNQGVYHNAMVAWELYGPAEEDYRFLTPEGLSPNVVKSGNQTQVTAVFSLRHPGNYRLRAATVDLTGRSTVTWTAVTVTE